MDQSKPTTASPDSNGNGGRDAVMSIDYPMTEDLFDVMDLGNDSLLYYSKISQEDIMNYYRDEVSTKGYEQRELLTVISEGVFSIIFDGDLSGRRLSFKALTWATEVERFQSGRKMDK